MQKYVDVPKNDIKSRIENAWFATCREKNIPFVTLKARTKFADVHWDYIAYPTDIDVVLEKKAAYIHDAAIAIFMSHANKKSKYTVSNHLIWYQNLEISGARLAASELYDLIASCVGAAINNRA